MSTVIKVEISSYRIPQFQHQIIHVQCNTCPQEGTSPIYPFIDGFISCPVYNLMVELFLVISKIFVLDMLTERHHMKIMHNAESLLPSTYKTLS